jgi:hypothetical protein
VIVGVFLCECVVGGGGGVKEGETKKEKTKRIWKRKLYNLKRKIYKYRNILVTYGT